MGFSGGSDGKESTCNKEDLGSTPRLGRCPGEMKGYPLQYSVLENSMEPEEPGRLRSMGLQRVTEQQYFTTHYWSRDRLPTPVFLGFPCGSAVKVSACNVGDLVSTPGLGRSPGEMKGYPLQYSGLENSMDCIVHGVAKSWTRLSNSFTFTLNPQGWFLNSLHHHLK